MTYKLANITIYKGSIFSERCAENPLELKIYRVIFLKIHKMPFFLLFGPP